MTDKPKLPTSGGRAEVADFIAKVKAMPSARPGLGPGRLIFAMDATQSREPSWERACRIQADMFAAAATVGRLEVQLAWYRGFGEFQAEPWARDAATMIRRMQTVRCAAGQTQIEQVLLHAAAETRAQRVNALVFVGDAMEEEADRVVGRAGALGVLGVPAFVFHEGFDPVAERTFREIARLTKGAYCRFDASSAEMLRDLLAAVATFAAGGRAALADLGRKRGGAAQLLITQLR